MKTYERTHPWIKFELDLNRVPPDLWLLLGEARSKCEHLAGVPLRPKTAKMLHALYLAKGVLATTAIEGNTLSIEEVEKRIEGSLTLPQSKEYLGTEVDNVVRACSAIFDRTCMAPAEPISVEVIKSFNRMLLQNLELAPEVQPGELRHHDVGVARYRGAPWQDCEYLLSRMCEYLDEIATKVPEWMRGMPAGIVAGILGHLYLAWIHPFGDGNGRTARLLEFAILVKARVPTVAAHLLSNYYNDTRTRYYSQLQAASASGGDVWPFVRYATTGFVESLKEQIEVVRKEQLDIVWRNFVYGRFGDAHSERDVRQRTLVLDLSRTSRSVPFEAIAEISARVLRAYGKKTDKTLRRDLREMVEQKLLVLGKDGYRANKEQIEAFLPGRAPEKEVDSPTGQRRR
jgi:Fic family protein